MELLLEGLVAGLLGFVLGEEGSKLKGFLFGEGLERAEFLLEELVVLELAVELLLGETEVTLHLRVPAEHFILLALHLLHRPLQHRYHPLVLLNNPLIRLVLLLRRHLRLLPLLLRKLQQHLDSADLVGQLGVELGEFVGFGGLGLEL